MGVQRPGVSAVAWPRLRTECAWWSAYVFLAVCFQPLTPLLTWRALHVIPGPQGWIWDSERYPLEPLSPAPHCQSARLMSTCLPCKAFRSCLSGVGMGTGLWT